MITVACVLVRGNVPFTPEYVTRMRSMVRGHLPVPHRFVCLTDQQSALPPDVETVRIEPPPGLPGWWAKMELFNRAHRLEGRKLYLDLDTLVVGSLLPVVEFPSEFALVPDAGSWQGRNGLKVVKRFNSSVMVWDEVPHRLYYGWTPFVARRLWGDQDWIGEQCPDASKMPLEWFPRLSELVAAGGQHEPPWRSARVVLCKKPKNREAADLFPWFNERWR